MREQVQGKSRYGLPWVDPEKVGRPRWTFKNPIVPNVMEEYYEAMRDVLITSPSYALGEQTAFAIPIAGTYTPLGAATGYQKTRWDTNLYFAAQLPNPELFQLEAVSVQLHPATHPTDAQAWAAQNLVTLTIGADDKRYVELQPMFMGCAGGLFSSGPILQATPADFDGHMISNGWPLTKNVHVLGDSVDTGAQIIEQTQPFHLKEDPTQDKYDAPYTTAADTAVFPIGRGVTAFYMLHGHWGRGAQ